MSADEIERGAIPTGQAAIEAEIPDRWSERKWMSGSVPTRCRYSSIRPELLRAARYNLRKGATQIKIMAGGGVSTIFDPLHVVQFTPEEMRAAVQAAEDWGTYVLAHAYHDDSVNRAIDAGVRVIEHGFLMSEATVRRMKDERRVVPVFT